MIKVSIKKKDIPEISREFKDTKDGRKSATLFMDVWLEDTDLQEVKWERRGVRR